MVSLNQKDAATAEYIKNRHWSRWDSKRMELFKKEGSDLMHALVKTGKISPRYLKEIDELRQTLASPGKVNVEEIQNRQGTLMFQLQMDKIITSEEVNLIHQGIEQQSTKEEENVEMNQKITDFYKQYGTELAIIEKNQEAKKLYSYLADILGTQKGILFDLTKTQLACAGFEEYVPLHASQLKALAQMDVPFYYAYLKAKNDELLAKIEENKLKGGFTIHKSPDSEEEAFFSEMLKPFDGKVIFVDFWATWCGPCRNAMKQFEPTKARFEGKEVVFVYVTDESSPLGRWNNMIPDIPGEHFRLNRAQNDILRKNFDIRGIPAYLILNKKGEQVYFKVGFEGADKLSGIIRDELAK